MKHFIDLNEINKKIKYEIKKYKWLESEKAGYDIGGFKAAKEWLEKYYFDFLNNELFNQNINNSLKC